MSARARHTLRLFTLVVGCLGIGAAVGLAQDGAPDTPGSSGPLVERIEADQAQGFAVLRRQRVAADELPPRAADSVRLGPAVELAANAALARQARTGNGLGLYVVPGRGELCLADSSGAVSCNATAAAQAGQVATATRTTAGLARVAGLVPDGVAKVTVHLAGGSSATAPVTDNAYVSEQPLQVVGVSFARGGSVHEVPIVSP